MPGNPGMPGIGGMSSMVGLPLPTYSQQQVQAVAPPQDPYGKHLKTEGSLDVVLVNLLLVCDISFGKISLWDFLTRQSEHIQKWQAIC